MSGNYFGIPHIIGGKLTIIGGRLSATEQRTNKVSTFDEASQTWISYYPDININLMASLVDFTSTSNIHFTIVCSNLSIAHWNR